MSIEVRGILSDALVPTRLLRVVVHFQGRLVSVGLKLERDGPTGSVKDRTAVGLLEALDRKDLLAPGRMVIESTSGNLGVAMARLLGPLECQFIAVVDPRTPEPTRRLLCELGAGVVVIEEPDDNGGFVLGRLRYVRDLCAADPDLVWPDQYDNPANPGVHERTTGPEIAAQAGISLDALYVAVSTGGTLAGISSFFRRHDDSVKIIAVDVEGSRAVAASAGLRVVPGIGSSRPSAFLWPGAYDRVRHVSTASSFAICRMVYEDLALRLGGSSGSVIGAMVAELPTLAPRFPACLCPDDGDKYLDSFYSDAWLTSKGLSGEVAEIVERLRCEGLFFRWEM